MSKKIFEEPKLRVIKTQMTASLLAGSGVSISHNAKATGGSTDDRITVASYVTAEANEIFFDE